LAMSAGAAQALDEGAAMARAEQRALSSLRERLPPLTCDASLHGFSGPYVAGKYSLLLFWAPWCGPCKPVMDELASLDPEGDIAVLTASQFRPEDAQRPDEEYGLSAVRMLLAQHNLEKPTCAYTNKAQRLAWAGGIPRLILFGRSGSVEAVAIGGDRCEALIGKLRAGWRP
jgi:thiol-disulfide isomerase/thioredoxin